MTSLSCVGSLVVLEPEITVRRPVVPAASVVAAVVATPGAMEETAALEEVRQQISVHFSSCVKLVVFSTQY